MPYQNFWLSVRAIAAFLDDHWDLEEVTLRTLHDQLKQLKPEERMERRREITLIVSQLARLEMRMVEEGRNAEADGFGRLARRH